MLIVTYGKYEQEIKKETYEMADQRGLQREK